MKYDAITIDTNVIVDNGYNLESGLLGQLSQFKDGPGQFVLSEIVLRELRRHLIVQAEDVREKLARAIKGSRKHMLISANDHDALLKVHAAASTPQEAVKQRLTSFVEATGCEIVRADQTNIKSLIKLYFETSPPFEESGKKKSEFPDAICLLSLENWATTEKKKILAVSKDRGWKDFSEKSATIDCFDDLSVALEQLQKDAELAEKFVSKFLEEVDAGKHSDQLEFITELIAGAVNDLSPEIDASSAYHYDVTHVEAQFQRFTFYKSNGNYNFSIVQIGKDKVVANIAITFEAQITAEFDFSIWDSIDSEYVSMGSGSAETEEEIEASVLLTFEGEFGAGPDSVEVSDVELVEHSVVVDLGDVGIDYSEDHD